MKRGTLGWYRMRMISGLIFGVLGLVIAVELAMKPGAPVTKIAGFGFVVVALALAAVRIQQYLRARAAGR